MRLFRRLVLFGAAPVVSFTVAAMWFDHRATRPVEGETSTNFPLLVLVPSSSGALRARAVFAGQLPELRRENPGLEFMIPAGREDDARRDIASGPECQDRRGFAQFSVDSREDSQLFSVEAWCDSDYANVGRYVATRSGIKPISHKSYLGPSLMMVPFVVSGLFTLVVWPVAWILMRAADRQGPGQRRPTRSRLSGASGE